MDIILAEDDRNNRFVIAAHLQLHGHTVRTATNGAEAVDLVRQQRPDVVLMDLMMPVMDGFEAATMIHREHHGRTPRMVAVSALDGIVERAERSGAHFDAVLAKPFSVEQLVHALAPAAACA
ncbi:MAG: response regulator [Fimbriimonadaceae bacterium]|nr:response regulator [Fimbriimonadaceae bacterium]